MKPNENCVSFYEFAVFVVRRRSKWSICYFQCAEVNENDGEFIGIKTQLIERIEQWRWKKKISKYYNRSTIDSIVSVDAPQTQTQIDNQIEFNFSFSRLLFPDSFFFSFFVRSRIFIDVSLPVYMCFEALAIRSSAGSRPIMPFASNGNSLTHIYTQQHPYFIAINLWVHFAMRMRSVCAGTERSIFFLRRHITETHN